MLLLLFVLLKLNKKKKYLLHRQSKATLTKLTTRAGGRTAGVVRRGKR